MIVSLQLTILQWLLLKYVINIFPKVVDRFQCDVKKEQTIQPENGNHRYLQSLSIKEGFWRALTRHTDKNSFINVCYPAKNLPNNTCQGLVQACFQPLDVYEGYAAANVSVFDQLVVLNYLKDVGQVKVLLHCSHVQGSPYSFISEEFYVFNWLTPLACSEYKIGKDCRLTTTDNYIFDLSSLNEEVVKFNDTSLFISACRSHSKCGVGSSACLNNGNSTTNIGNFASNLFFNNNSQPSLLYQFENYTTNVIFLCGDNPISVKQVTENNYEIIWYTLLVCRQTIECSLIYKNLSYDLSILSQSNINWQVEISPELKTKFQRSKVYMNVCRPLVRDVLNKNCSSSSGLCIIHEDRVINVGQMIKSPYMDNGDIILEYSGGDMCKQNKNYSALVRLLDKNAMEIGNPYLKNDTDCVYQITWITSAAWHIMDERINASQTYDCKVVDKVTGIVFDINPLYNETGYLVNNTKGIFIVTVCGKLNNTECANSAISCIPAINDTGTWKLGYDEILYMNLWGHKHLIMFICDESAGVGHPELVDFIKPRAIFVWRTTYACKTMMQCTAFSDDGKAIELSSLGVPYFYNVTNEISNNVTGKFMLNICKGVVGTKCSPMSGACHENGQVTKNLGYLKDRPQFLSSGNVEILYENGGICDSENNLSSVIKIVCNISTENPIVKLISFEKCKYEFYLETKTVCQDNFLTTDVPTTGANVTTVTNVTTAVPTTTAEITTVTIVTTATPTTGADVTTVIIATPTTKSDITTITTTTIGTTSTAASSVTSNPKTRSGKITLIISIAIVVAVLFIGFCWILYSPEKREMLSNTINSLLGRKTYVVSRYKYTKLSAMMTSDDDSDEVNELLCKNESSDEEMIPL